MNVKYVGSPMNASGRNANVPTNGASVLMYVEKNSLQKRRVNVKNET